MVGKLLSIGLGSKLMLFKREWILPMYSHIVPYLRYAFFFFFFLLVSYFIYLFIDLGCVGQ